MKPRTYRQILDEIAQQHSPKDIDLSSNILTKFRKEKVAIMKSKFAISGLITMAVLLVVFFTVPGVASAMERLIGFIPGVGLVENGTSLRVLKETALIDQEGTSISVTQGVVDSQKTTIVFQVKNLPNLPASSDIQVSDICYRLPELQLPDGSRLEGSSEAGNSWISGYNRRIIFPVLPKDVNTVKLVFSCLQQSIKSPDWSELEITLDFIQAEAGAQTSLLVDLPTPDPELPQSKSEVSTSVSDLRLVLNQYAKVNENVILFGALESLSGNNKIEMIDSDAVHLVDSRGTEIPLIEDPTIANPFDEVPNEASRYWAYRTDGAFSAGQATLTVDSAWIRINENNRFTFNVGVDTQPGQKLVLNQSLIVGGRKILIKGAEVNEGGDGLIFTIDKPEDVGTVNLMDLDHPLLGGGGGPDSYGFRYEDGIPSGEINVTLVSISVKIPGNWEATVDLPDLPNSSDSSVLASACLTNKTWQEALNNPTTIPEGLGGKLAMSNPMSPDYFYRVMTSNLDGTDHKIHAKGYDVSLSPDNRQIIYSSDTGLQLMDLKSGLVTPLIDTWKNDSDPIWSPDGSLIAFTRGSASGGIGAPGPYSIVIAKPDGTQQIPVVENGEANYVMAWFSDGKNLLYTVTGPNGASVNSINISTMQISHYFDTNYIHSNIALSPDEKQVAHEVMLPGENYGIQISDLDGSNPRLIVDAAPIVVTRPQWSPNGDWLVVSVSDESFLDTPVLALVEIDTCQIIPLTTLKGSVRTWNP